MDETIEAVAETQVETQPEVAAEIPTSAPDSVLVNYRASTSGITIPVSLEFAMDEEVESSFVDRIVDRITKMLSGETRKKKKKKYKMGDEERALDISQIWTQVDDYLWENSSDGWPYIVNFYANDDGSFYCVAALKGKLYKYDVTVSAGKVQVSDGVEVEIEHVPTGDSTETRAADNGKEYKPRLITRVFRQTDGTYRRIDIACTSVLNRVGEIDSRALFDSFVAHAKETGEYPYYTIYHQGEQLRTGQADFLMRSGDIYITSGVYDKSKLAAIEIRARRNNPTYYGISIGYAATKDPDVIEVAKDIFVRAYNEGINREISTLPESEAAAWFTNSVLMEVNRMAKMHPRAKSSLKKMMDDAEITDDELFDELTGDIDTTQRNIKDDKLVTRKGKTRDVEAVGDYEEFASTDDDDSPPKVKPGAPADGDVDDDAQDVEDEEADDDADDADDADDLNEERAADDDEMVFDAEAIEGIARAMVEAIANDPELAQSFADAIAGVSRSTGNDDLTNRIAALEEDDEERFSRYLEDLPEVPRTSRKRRTGRAPGRGDDDNHVYTSADVVDEALQNAPY